MTAALAQTADDPRRAPRERVMLVAQLSFNQGAITVPCVASNLSATGARLSVSADVVLAQSMRLSVPQREIDTPVRLVWRRGNVVAVTFEASAALAVAPVVNKSLEAENRELRERVVQLEKRIRQLEQGY